MYTQKILPGSLIKPPVTKKVKSGCVLLNKGEEVGAHKTAKREEIIVILQGKATIIIEGERKTVEKNNVVYIPPDKIHNICNESEEELKYIYIVTLLD